MAEYQWYQNAVFYEAYVRAFYDSNGDGNGDLRGLTEKLGYLKDLGIDCVWLLPIYPSPLKDDGYDIADFYGIHPDFGTLEDFKNLLEKAHSLGLRVIADLVLNHTSDQHRWFQAGRASKDSPYHDYYVWSDTDQKYAGARIIFLDTEKSNWTWDETAGQFFWHRFYSSQPDLNFDNPAVRAEFLKIMKFWLDLGVDGFRADAVPYLFEREGTNCENLPETHAYLKELRRFIDTNYPGRVLLCEANQWPKDVRAYFGDGDEFQLAFNFPLMPRVFMALRQGDASPIRWAVDQIPSIPAGCQWCTFLRNHDELTLEMVTAEEREWMWREYAPEKRMRLNLGIRRRLAPLLDNDLRKIELAEAINFSLPGTPIVYYGDEIGMGDNTELPDRNGVRTPMQWDGSASAGFSKAARSYSPVVSNAAYPLEKVNVEVQRSNPDSLWNLLHRMIAIRKEHLAFGLGSLEWVEPHSKAVLAYWRHWEDDRLLCIHNLSDLAFEIHLPVKSGTQELTDQFTRRAFAVRDGWLNTRLEGYQFLWLR